MMKNYVFMVSMFLCANLLSTSAFAARFTRLTKFTSPAVQALAKTSDKIASSEAFGDAGEIIQVSFTRKSSETNIKTIKQLTISRGVANYGDNDGIDASGVSIERLVEQLFNNVEVEDEDLALTAHQDVARLLNEIRKDSTLEIYTAGHGDDDGSWSAVEILDTVNRQILIVKLGFYGN